MSTDEQHLVPASRRRGGLAATRGGLAATRGGLAAIRGGHQESERSFFCRICQRAERGVWVPAAWYLLERAPGGKGRHIRLGLYCSVACLVCAGEMLEAGAAEHAARMDLPTEEDRRRERARVVEVAQMRRAPCRCPRSRSTTRVSWAWPRLTSSSPHDRRSPRPGRS
ncbi:hypothetical protein AB0F88_43045 [Streptosporangium sp. NPDC023963]|uniref:hypothetical protein n=1 Tax=Streptosporangium sp. NPDC023963 TaxID=3155608 RepID=UPI003411FEC0